MKAGLVVSLVALGMVSLLYGCGGTSSQVPGAEVVAPDSPGDPAALIGTTWADAEGKLSLQFTDDTNVMVAAPQFPKPMPGQYSVEDGVVTIRIPLQVLTGTWDGNALVLNGTPLARK